ncbi:MCE family protein [Mycobacterium noviomagense]|uniref:Mammalian cell entry protein n=1 Tax=Mycobacterium noviomagense TaxID=459858 RepID=A0A7I7PAK1_9MYCO|nr:MCE family protein [Mycobacterium noviomagense]ORB15132.1 mammalian cell entry protein [Mycobacterium noviomagense]BBY05617.1 mammalian cell entry protein [Mycobacterium noviomagense]
MRRNRLAALLAIGLALLLVAGAAVAIRNTFFHPKTITAYFTSATGIYPGDDVRVAGIKVGSIAAIQPEGTQAKMTMHVDHGVPIPADVKAVIVAQNLVAARYVQFTPAYRSSGPTMGNGSVIPVERTAVPVEWDEVKDQLMRLATDLGPSGKVSSSSIGRFIDSAANALGGNGDKLRQTLAQLSGVGRTLADGSGNIVEIIKNLQTFVTALRNSGQQLVQFNNRLATLTSVLDDSRSDLDAALTNLAAALPEVQRFIAGTRDPLAEQIARLADLTQILVDSKMALENVLHVTPNALANAYADYDVETGVVRGTFALSNFTNAVWAVCSQMGAIENVTATETGKLCAQYAGPALRVVNPFTFISAPALLAGGFGFFPNFNYLHFPFNPILSKSASPENIVYTEARLAPGGEGPKPGPPELPPAVSAYTGLPGDPVGPPGAVPPARIPGAAMPQPPAPTRPGESPPPPPPPAPNLPGMLLPAEGPQS